MIIYNITIKIIPSIKVDWLNWLKDEYIPGILDTGCFTRATILQLLETDDTDGPTYAVQFSADSKAIYNLYIEKFADAMSQKSFAQWGDRFIAFATVMHVVN